MKKSGVLFLLLMLVFNLVLGSQMSVDASMVDTVINLQIDNQFMTVNGVQTEIDPGNGTVPVVMNGRTLVPVRAIIESLGGQVGWNGAANIVSIHLNGNTVSLVIDSTVAYLNGKAQNLDVAPAVINSRTMLPIRFVAESFGLEVGWNDASQTVTLIQKVVPSVSYSFSAADVPAYSGSPYVAINNNVPMFTAGEITSASFEYYSPLDYFGRCGVCIASVSTDIMPTEDRESISSVKPSGWMNVAYNNVDGGYLYNRCHLIGFQLTGENANVNNIITGTRYMNIEGMLPFENMVADYIKETGNHVMYRATPVFEGGNLVASGVLLEAYSVEDGGAGISFCVYCYNVQPGITINYTTGSSTSQATSAQPYTPHTSYTPPASGTNDTYSAPSSAGNGNPYGYYILNTSSKKYHEPSCGTGQRTSDKNKATSTQTSAELRAQGYTPCGNCDPA